LKAGDQPYASKTVDILNTHRVRERERERERDTQRERMFVTYPTAGTSSHTHAHTPAVQFVQSVQTLSWVASSVVWHAVDSNWSAGATHTHTHKRHVRKAACIRQAACALSMAHAHASAHARMHTLTCAAGNAVCTLRVAVGRARLGLVCACGCHTHTRHAMPRRVSRMRHPVALACTRKHGCRHAYSLTHTHIPPGHSKQSVHVGSAVPPHSPLRYVPLECEPAVAMHTSRDAATGYMRLPMAHAHAHAHLLMAHTHTHAHTPTRNGGAGAVQFAGFARRVAGGRALAVKVFEACARACGCHAHATRFRVR
jgi:hypothetical protein